MPAELLAKAIVNLYSDNGHEVVSSAEVEDKTASQLYAIAKDLLSSDPRADYAKVEFHNRTMTITR